MTTATQPPIRSRWLGIFLAALVAVLATVFGAATASAEATTGAETRVRASQSVAQDIARPPEDIRAGQRLGNEPVRVVTVVATGVAANGGPRTLYHYTDDAGLKGILDSKRLNPSLGSVNPKDVRYGNGQYVSDIVPGTKTCAQLSRCFLGQPFQGQRFKNFVEIDVTGLNVSKGRDGVYVIPGESPLDISRRLISWGAS